MEVVARYCVVNADASPNGELGAAILGVASEVLRAAQHETTTGSTGCAQSGTFGGQRCDKKGQPRGASHGSQAQHVHFLSCPASPGQRATRGVDSADVMPSGLYTCWILPNPSQFEGCSEQDALVRHLHHCQPVPRLVTRILVARTASGERTHAQFEQLVKYTRLAAIYDRLFGNRWIAAARQRVYNLLPDLPPGARLLLDGVGTGADLPFVPVNVRAVGVDLVEPMLRRIRAGGTVAVRLALMNAESLGFADRSFEVVVLSLLLSVVEDGAAAFDEAVRVTRPGGYLLVFDKFAPAGREASCTRRVLNIVTSALGTDITRHLADLVEGQPVDILFEDCSLLGGFYQATLFRRHGPAEVLPKADVAPTPGRGGPDSMALDGQSGLEPAGRFLLQARASRPLTCSAKKAMTCSQESAAAAAS